MKQKVLPSQGVLLFPGSAVKWKDEVSNRKGFPANAFGGRNC